MGKIAAALLLVLATGASGAPRIPASESEVLERLPVKAADPVARELRALRADLASDPGNVTKAATLARRYFDLATAEGDPRYIGYAEAVLRPWIQKPDPAVEVLFVRALLTQYRHDFAPAMADLDKVLGREPRHVEALSWKWALYMVQADYARAREVCERRRKVGSALGMTACFAAVDSINGKAREAYSALSTALARDPGRDAEYRAWIHTRLAEFAQRAGDAALAEKHFRQAIATGATDGFVLAAYADLLLDAKRHAEVVALLKDWARSDVLLLRLALAEHALGSPAAAQRARALAARFADSARRGDQLHLQEESRFELQLRGDAQKALSAALEDWKTQREPRDARVLMEAAIAARQPAAAQPALEWMRQTGYQDPRYRALAETLGKMPR
jgi:Tfp pilus assembly protein PilF